MRHRRRTAGIKLCLMRIPLTNKLTIMELKTEQDLSAFYYAYGYIPEHPLRKQWIEAYEATGRSFKERPENPLKKRFGR